MADADARADLETWYRRYFESDDYEEFNIEVLGPYASSEQVSRWIHWLDLRPPQRVLDLCSGAGRHTLEFARRGFRAVGVDLSPYQLGKSRLRARASRAIRGWPGPEPLFVRADARSVPLRDGCVEAVLCLFNSFGYFSEEGNRAVLREVGRVLVQGGRLALDVMNRDAFLIHQPQRTWDRVRGGLVLQDIEYLVRTSQLRTTWTYVREDGGSRALTTLNRLYSAHELVRLCESAGFEVLDINDGEVRGYFDVRNSHVVAVVAQKART